MSKITVEFPIKVPSGKYCWEYYPPHEICEYLDNEGGFSTCILGFDQGKDTKKGILKAEKCLKFRIKK